MGKQVERWSYVFRNAPPKGATRNRRLKIVIFEYRREDWYEKVLGCAEHVENADHYFQKPSLESTVKDQKWKLLFFEQST